MSLACDLVKLDRTAKVLKYIVFVYVDVLVLCYAKFNICITHSRVLTYKVSINIYDITHSYLYGTISIIGCVSHARSGLFFVVAGISGHVLRGPYIFIGPFSVRAHMHCLGPITRTFIFRIYIYIVI